MIREAIEMVKEEDKEKKTKKVYEIPKVTIHGTLAKITKQKGAAGSDGPATRSV